MKLDSRWKPLAAVGCLLALGAGIALAATPPRLVWINDALRIDYGWQNLAGTLLAAVAALVWALALARLRSLRVAAITFTGFALYQAIHLSRYRVHVSDAFVEERSTLGLRGLPWRSVRSVESGTSAILLLGPGEERIHIDVSRLGGADRAMLDRTLARRVRESR